MQVDLTWRGLGQDPRDLKPSRGLVFSSLFVSPCLGLVCGMCPSIETARLVLRGHTEADLPALAAMWAHPDVVRHVTRTPSTLKESWFRLLRYRGLWPVLGYGYWCVAERESGRYVGDVGFADFRRETDPPVSGIPKAGWVLSPWAHGRGLGGEAVSAVFDWLDRAIQPKRVVCMISDENLPSIKIARRNGFVAAGAVTLAGDKIPLWSRERSNR